MRTKLIFFLSAIFLASSSFVHAQDAPVKPSVATGDVTSITAEKIILKTTNGEVTVELNDKTEFKRVSPEKPSLKTAMAAAASDIGTGDKLMVTGVLSADKKTIPARAVYLMTKADIAQKQSKDAAEWTTRGISGRVASVDPATGQIGVEVRGLAGSTTVAVTPKEDAVFRRYAPNSVKYSEATVGTVQQIQVGDMLRALGDKNADGTAFAAEEVLTGAFQTVAGAVKSVDVAKNEVVITDSRTKKDVTVELGTASVMKKFPEEMATRMAAFQGGQGRGGMRPGGAGRPEGAAQGERPAGAQGGRGGQRSGGIDDMLDRFPNITAADLKAGDVIAVSSSKNNTPERISAIKLLAGVEPFLKAAQAQGTNSGRRDQGGQSLSIPGLDGIDFQ